VRTARLNTRAPAAPPLPELAPQPPALFDDELIMHLERDQLVAETSRPVPRLRLGRRAVAALWALRVFVVIVSVMVVYTFIDQLH
jgi:hypothetical protein